MTVVVFIPSGPTVVVVVVVVVVPGGAGLPRTVPVGGLSGWNRPQRAHRRQSQIQQEMATAHAMVPKITMRIMAEMARTTMMVQNVDSEQTQRRCIIKV